MVESTQPTHILGGFSGFKPLDQESEEFVIFLSLQDLMEEKAASKFEQFEIIDFQSQVVAGTNYKLRIRIASGDSDIIHVEVFQPLPHTGLPAEVKSIGKGRSMQSAFDASAADSVDVVLDAGGDVVMSQEESSFAEPEEKKEEEPQGQPISGLVKAEEVSMLMDMGYSKIVAEKSLFLTQPHGVPKAMEWIEKNCEAADFEEELFLMGTQESSKPKSNMSLEERQQKAKELQETVRKRMDAQEKKNKIESEAARVKMDKDMAANKVIEDERRHKLDIAEKIREKQQAEERLQKQRRQYELDMQERFGKDWKMKADADKEAKKPQLTPQQMVENGIKMVTTIYTEARQPGVATLCLKTCQTLINNLIKDTSNEKFQKINLENKAIQERVGKINGGVMILKGAGFVSSEENPLMLVNTQPNMAILNEAAHQLKWKLD